MAAHGGSLSRLLLSCCLGVVSTRLVCILEIVVLLFRFGVICF